ncbi:MAG: 8-oxo-dGTP diphosphatase [Cellvibrionaceae bacterium]|jgi:8-oxo-dGTP diphosphatase
MSEIIHVAVGVLINSNREVLLAKRKKQAHQGGLWEFPGGKVEPGETVFSALKRELQEEVGITIRGAKSFLTIQHDYGDKAVLLDVWFSKQFSGRACGLEGQPIKWLAIEQLPHYPFPAANQAIIDKLLEYSFR